MQDPIRRRTFLQTGAALTGAALLPSFLMQQTPTMPKPITIKRVNSGFEREALRRPFGFKGGSLTSLWQTIAYLESTSGTGKIGLGTQSVLWSDNRVFNAHTAEGGNALMYAILERALQMAAGESFTDPVSLLEKLLPPVYEYGKGITRQADLRQTFILNALTALDNAAWLLYAAENGYGSFDEMIPQALRPGVSARHDKVACLPALGYGTPREEIETLADQGFFILKIKIGAPGDQKEMLEKDKVFLKMVHDTMRRRETPHWPDGRIPYYFDANGRYEHKDTLHRFLDFAEEIGALDRIAVLEEPFGEGNETSVNDITARGPRVAADESAQSVEDTLHRIEQGYNAIAVKAVAKTMSMTLKIAQAAYGRKVPCFCADLTVNPILVDWNKNVAARLPAFPGLDFGLQETNGWQNYRDWDKMMSYHPFAGAAWTKPVNGVYATGGEFLNNSGGIFKESEYYRKLVV